MQRKKAMTIQTVLDDTPNRMVNSYWHFERTYFLRLQSWV